MWPLNGLTYNLCICNPWCVGNPCNENSTCTNTIGTFICAGWILVLSTASRSSPALIINGKGTSTEIGFTYDVGTEVAASCSVVWHGQMFMFGGFIHKRQISLVDQCRLKLIGELPFNMFHGACAQRDDSELFICFENYAEVSSFKNCRVSNGPLKKFSKLPTSTYEHGTTRVAVTSGK